MYASGGLAILILLTRGFPFKAQSAILFGGLLLIPGGIDGGTQLMGDRESTNTLRVLTGILLGLGLILLLSGAVEYIFSYF